MKILILGGTAFVGRHLAAAALARGHAVTLFNRGRNNPDLFPEAEHLVGDRDGGLGALEAGHWDAVIDTCGYVPRLVRASAEALRERAPFYVFISTIAVYAEGRRDQDESAPLGTLEDPTVETIDGGTYGPLKVLCEEAVRAVYGDRALIIRPGIIAGPHDPTDRFTYWAQVMAGDGEVLAPAPAEAPLQVIDARDLADWTLRLIEQGVTGAFNATGPAAPCTRADFLESLRPLGQVARVRWLDTATMAAEGLEPQQAFPFWMSPENAGYLGVCTDKALRAGLTLRPLVETARDTLAWLGHEPARPLKFGLEPALVTRLQAT